MITVAVAYALPQQQTVIDVQVPVGTTALDAVRASGILQRYPELDAQTLALGVFGTAVPHDRVVNAGDRVEIYRPMQRDPIAARRRRARQQGR